MQHEGVQNHQGAAGTGQLRKLAALVHEVAELAGTGARRTLRQVAGDHRYRIGGNERAAAARCQARPKLPDQIWTRTPWHQDAQYYRDAADGHVISLWYPLQAVTEHNRCLPVAPRMHRGPGAPKGSY